MSQHWRKVTPHVLQIITPEGPLSMIRPVAEKLFKEGVISGALDGVLHAKDAATVKAALATYWICDFCSAPGPEHSFEVPDFEMPHEAGTSTQGWAACNECAALVHAGKRKELLARAVEGMAFPKFSKLAIAELHERFWKAFTVLGAMHTVAESLADFVEDRMPPDYPLPEWSTRDKRIHTIMRGLDLSREEVEGIVSGKMADLPASTVTKMAAWSEKLGTTDGRVIADYLRGVRKPAMPDQIPHWQKALDAKFEVVATLQQLMRQKGSSHYFPDAIDLNDKAAVIDKIHSAQQRREFRDLHYNDDLRLLPGAQAYSFNAETEAAIQEAAHSIPHDAPLSSIETPNTGSGWFWFDAPITVQTNTSTENIRAMLWSWTDESTPGVYSRAPSLLFSVYESNESGKLAPVIRWYWRFEHTFHEMLAANTLSWRRTFGPGGPMEHTADVVPEEVVLGVITDLSLFFMMACLWFRQTVPGEPKKTKAPILTQSAGHIERHARKRYQREHRLAEVPTVQVIALRKTAKTAAADAPEERKEGAREYKCRWIVQGHPRLQPCGPGRKDRKLIWIDSHPAGPADKPLRTKVKVFAVVR